MYSLPTKVLARYFIALLNSAGPLGRQVRL